MISISIVSYNSSEVTIKAIESVLYWLSKTNLEYEVIIVDNASTDDTVECIRMKFPKIHLIILEENIGFGRAHNIAIQYSKGEIIFIVNSDIIIVNDVFTNMQKYFKLNSEIAAIGPLILEKNDLRAATSRDRVLYSLPSTMISILNLIFPVFTRNEVRNLPKWLRSTLFSSHQSVNPSFESREVLWVDGMFVAFSRHHLLKSGLFDSFYFFDNEIGDLLIRIHQNGGKIFYDTGSVVRHLGGYSRKKNPKIIQESLIGYVHYLYNNFPSYFSIITLEILFLSLIKIAIASISRKYLDITLWKKVFSSVLGYWRMPKCSKYTIPNLTK